MELNQASDCFNLSTVESALVGVPFGINAWPAADANGLLEAIMKSSVLLHKLDGHFITTPTCPDPVEAAQKLAYYQDTLVNMADVVITHLANDDISQELESIVSRG